jgi:geranylgeranyl diphosphate synthase type II
MMRDLKTYLEEKKRLVEDTMRKRWLSDPDLDPTTLHQSMQYSLFADGKRVRPALTLAVADVLGMAQNDVLPIAAALEMIHVFSLIHDDLPAMDDDDLRRGQPTNHKVFGEGMAILAGDALLALAFVPLTEFDLKKYRAENVLKVIRMIAEATGAPGMIGGQVIDIESEGKTIPIDRLRTLHRLKTGASHQGCDFGACHSRWCR